MVAALLFLYLADVDLTAALTGLGVGGIAIGFGAQKTIENLFGGIMVISDKPINVGDLCRAGEFMGTVEDIGIRSTRIRTHESNRGVRAQRSAVGDEPGKFFPARSDPVSAHDRAGTSDHGGADASRAGADPRPARRAIPRWTPRLPVPGSSDSAAGRWTWRSSPTCSSATSRRFWPFRNTSCSASWTFSKPPATSVAPLMIPMEAAPLARR